MRMRRVTIKLVAVCLASLFTVACGSDYRGYGEFTDNGAGAAMERYMVDFGKVHLGKPGQKAFKMAGLPHVEFTMGLRPATSPDCDKPGLDKVVIELDVQAEDGAVVVHEEGPLGDWTASSSIVYRRGAERVESLPGGASRHVRIDVHTAQGWGTYFTPESSATYLAKFYVRETEGMTGCQTRLVLLGGGWK